MIRFSIKGRGEGKTTALIHAVANTDKIIVCRDDMNCKSIKLMADRMGCIIKMPISYFDFIRKTLPLGRNIDKYLIDELDDFLDFAFNGVIYAATLTPKAGL